MQARGFSCFCFSGFVCGETGEYRAFYCLRTAGTILLGSLNTGSH